MLKKIKLNLGTGNIVMPDYINHDIIKHRPEIDIAFDLNDKDWTKVIDWDGRVKERIDLEVYKIEGFDEIRAWDVLEHLDDPINFFDNCWRLLKEDGILDLKVCGWKNPNAHVDLTHKRPGFDIKSFDYLDPNTELGVEYGYYTDKRWKIIEKHYDRNMNVLVKLTPVK